MLDFILAFFLKLCWPTMKIRDQVSSNRDLDLKYAAKKKSTRRLGFYLPLNQILSTNKVGTLIMEYLFGPVLSRRLGLSMGVDLLNYKTCNLDCVYCELGKTKCLASSRDRFVPSQNVLREIKSRADEDFDHLTFAGSGEPTLSRDLGEIIRRSKEMVNVPVAVITNSTLLSNKEVRDEAALADVVLPTLDATTQATFQKINRPSKDLRIDQIIEGLRDFRSEFSGEIWLEVMLVKDVNDYEAEQIARVVESISPDRVQLNTVVRLPAEPVLPLDEAEMIEILDVFQEAEIIPDWDWRVPETMETKLLEILSARPRTIDEIGRLAGLEKNVAVKYAIILERDGKIKRRLLEGKHYFVASAL
jgi:wyosine [tRNA(Phe)-imidazoG37] synthetase (radical SAM superfamily)